MLNIKSMCGIALGSALATVAYVASAADVSSSFFAIERLEAGVGGEEGYVIDPLSYTAPNPKGCPSTGWVFMNPARSAAEREAMNKLLVGAFLAGKKVQVYVSDTTCSGGASTGYPVYNNVRLAYNE